MCLYTRCIQKISRILCLSIFYFLFCPLQSHRHQILYTCANVFFSNHLSTSKNHFLWFCSSPPSISVLARGSLRWLSLGFHVITLNPWFVNSYDSLEQIWVVADRGQWLLSNVNAMLFLVEIEQFWYEFRGDPCLKWLPSKALSGLSTLETTGNELHTRSASNCQFLSPVVNCWILRHV